MVSLTSSFPFKFMLWCFLGRTQQGHSMWLVQHCARDILEALAFLHREVYVHADLKPRNILWSADDEVFKLIDFGLSFKEGNQVGVSGDWKNTGRGGGIIRYCISNSLPPSPPPGCQVHPDRRISRPRGWASEQPRSGRGGGGGGLGLHGRRGSVELGHHPVGDVLRNQTQRHRPLTGVEGRGGRYGPQIISQYFRVFMLQHYSRQCDKMLKNILGLELTIVVELRSYSTECSWLRWWYKFIVLLLQSSCTFSLSLLLAVKKHLIEQNFCLFSSPLG